MAGTITALMCGSGFSVGVASAGWSPAGQPTGSSTFALPPTTGGLGSAGVAFDGRDRPWLAWPDAAGMAVGRLTSSYRLTEVRDIPGSRYAGDAGLAIDHSGDVLAALLVTPPSDSKIPFSGIAASVRRLRLGLRSPVG